jgi:ATP-dependent RNA helicase RhlE
LLKFSDLGLSTPLLSALAAEGYAAPTPIQSQAIPPALGGRDLCGIAQTGTGKTAAFALPILQRLAAMVQRPAPQTCRALVLSPTRELANQIADSFRTYGTHVPLSTAVVFGGVPIGPQRQKLARGVDILVATPGRLLDLIETRSLALSSVQVLVLDEADRMLDLGFIHALRRIVKLLPRQRQTLLFSATMPHTIAALAEDYLNDPVKVVVAPAATTVERVEQGVVFVASDRKRDLLATLLRDPVFARVLVFTRTKHGADRVVRHLLGAGVEAAAIHGNKSQPQRERALAGFRDGQPRVLVATDIAARGIDVDDVSHVINFELPNVAADYVHRRRACLPARHRKTDATGDSGNTVSSRVAARSRRSHRPA